MTREILLSDLVADPTLLLRGSGADQTSIIGDAGDVIASVPGHLSRPVLYESLDDLLAGIEVDETDTSVIRDDWLD